MEERTETKLRRTERELFIILFAMADLIKSYDAYYKDFLKARTETGYRDIKAAEAFFNKAIAQIMDTIPLKDLEAVRRQLINSEIEIKTKAAGVHNDGIWYLNTSDIAALVNAAIENKCVMCDNKSGRGCTLKHLIEGLPLEISADSVNVYMACFDRLKI